TYTPGFLQLSQLLLTQTGGFQTSPSPCASAISIKESPLPVNMLVVAPPVLNSVRNGVRRGKDFMPYLSPACSAGHAIPTSPHPTSYSRALLVINRLSVAPPTDRIFYGRDHVFHTIRKLPAYITFLTYVG